MLHLIVGEVWLCWLVQIDKHPCKDVMIVGSLPSCKKSNSGNHVKEVEQPIDYKLVVSN